MEQVDINSRFNAIRSIDLRSGTADTRMPVGDPVINDGIVIFRLSGTGVKSADSVGPTMPDHTLRLPGRVVRWIAICKAGDRIHRPCHQESVQPNSAVVSLTRSGVLPNGNIH
jgi:hypothetical protein